MQHFDRPLGALPALRYTAVESRAGSRKMTGFLYFYHRISSESAGQNRSERKGEVVDKRSCALARWASQTAYTDAQQLVSRV